MASRYGYEEPYPDTRGDTFMMRNGHPGQHRGTDTAPGGKPALFPADGVLVKVVRPARPDKTPLGNTVEARFADGMIGGIAHLAPGGSSYIGQPVRRLEPFGETIGNTGSASSGRHMHSTLGYVVGSVYAGATIDPLAYYAAHPPTGEEPPRRGVSMFSLSKDPEGKVYLTGSTGIRLWIQSGDDAALLVRRQQETITGVMDTYFVNQLQRLDELLALVAPAPIGVLAFTGTASPA